VATSIVNQAVHSPVISAVNPLRPHASVYEIVTQRIIEQLEAGVAPWKKPWTSKAPANLCSTKEYRGLNVLMLASQGFPSRFWLTFNQANKLGGHIKRGAKGSLVVYWNIGEEREVTNPDGSTKTQTPFLLRYSTVFNLSQTEGIDIPAKLLGEQRENDPIADCEAIVSAMPSRPTLQQSDAAWYRPSTDAEASRIEMRSIRRRNTTARCFMSWHTQRATLRALAAKASTSLFNSVPSPTPKRN